MKDKLESWVTFSYILFLMAAILAEETFSSNDT